MFSSLPLLIFVCVVAIVAAFHNPSIRYRKLQTSNSRVQRGFCSRSFTLMMNRVESDEDSDDEYEEPSKLIDGKAIAAQIRLEVAEAVSKLSETSVRDGGAPIVPGLAVVLVGERPDSATYVRMKKKACAQVGIVDYGVSLPASCSQAELLELIERLNNDNRVHGILVQLPLPSQIDEQAVLEAVSVRKDVDGLHPLNLAALATTQTHKNTTGLNGAGTPGHDPCWDVTGSGGSSSGASARGFSVACTPLGCLELLDRSGVEVSGANVCVVGRSNMVGVPLAMLLMQRDATVTMVHSKTKNPAAVCAQADIVVVAVGRPELVGADWIKEGAVVIDVGINSVAVKPTAAALRQAALPPKQSLFASTAKTLVPAPKTTKLVGDVKFSEVLAKCSMVTPVPGGVGPMTIAMLLRNTLQSARRAALARADRIPGHDWGSTPSEALSEEVAAVAEEEGSCNDEAGTEEGRKGEEAEEESPQGFLGNQSDELEESRVETEEVSLEAVKIGV